MAEIRICLAPAIWQVIMLVAAFNQEAEAYSRDAHLSQDFLIFCSAGKPFSTKRKREIEELAYRLWPWQKIVWLERQYVQNLPFKEDPVYASLNLRKYIGVQKAHYMWTCHLATKVERAVAEVYAEAKIILYEDGIATYTNHRPKSKYFYQSWNQPVDIYRSIKLFLTRRSIYGRIQYNSYLNRYFKIYLYLAPDLLNEEYHPKITTVPIRQDFLENAISLLGCASTSAIFPHFSPFDKESILILGQPFSFGGFLAEEKEISFYKGIISSLLNKGYRVLWKEHPRSVEHPLFPKLFQQCPSDNFKKLEFGDILPIEVFAPKLNLIACISASSSSLFYLQKLYGIPTYSFASLLLPIIRNKEAEVGTTNLILEKVKPVDWLISKE